MSDQSIHLRNNPSLDTFYVDSAPLLTTTHEGPDTEWLEIPGYFATAPDAYDFKAASDKFHQEAAELNVNPNDLDSVAKNIESFDPDTIAPLSAIAKAVNKKRAEAVGDRAASLDSIYIPVEWAKENLKTGQSTEGNTHVAPQVITQDALQASGAIPRG